MEIIGKTNDGYILSASINDVKEILAAILGEAPKEISIGQKIPAIDYASTIRKIRGLKNNSTFINMLDYLIRLNDHVDGLKIAVESAATLE